MPTTSGCPITSYSWLSSSTLLTASGRYCTPLLSSEKIIKSLDPNCSLLQALEGGRLALLMAEDTNRVGTDSDREDVGGGGGRRELEELEELEGKRSLSWRRLEDISSYLVERLRQGQGRGLQATAGLLLCEIANLAADIAAIFLTNRS